MTKRQLKWFIGFIMCFMIYMLVVGILVLGNLLISGTWTRVLDLALYMGNVVAFGLSFYIMNQARKMKMIWLFLLGIFVFVSNALGIVKFYL